MATLNRMKRIEMNQKGAANRSGNHWKCIVFLVGALAIFGAGFKLSGIKGETTQSFIYAHPGLLNWMENWIPDNLQFYSESQVVNDRETTVRDSYYSGGSMSYTVSPNAIIEIPFEGRRVEWGGIADVHGGKAEVWIDGIQMAEVDGYSRNASKQVLYTSQVLTENVHQMILKAKADKNPLSEGNAIHLDYVKVWRGEDVQMLENDSSVIRYLHANSYYYDQFILRKFLHILLFGTNTLALMALASWAGIRSRWIWMLPTVMAVWAVGDEIHQWFVPGRHPAVFDVGVDSFGIAIGACLFLCASRMKRRIGYGS